MAGGDPNQGTGDSKGAKVEAYRRLKNGGSQFVRVEHVHVNEGGQAVIGNVGCRERG